MGSNPFPLVLTAARTSVALKKYNRNKVRYPPGGMSELGFTRAQLDRLRIGQKLRQIQWGSKAFKLLESKSKKT